ncbi:hypothetical protein LTR84_007260 [Exophiala bonariae]|uniref:Rhodanese domain-containing protein n=1 Tax=Exophiala bonariae TaxID=1690606 RepID=A0AAV9N2P0_9EURO|nr:hypothetical protein LTR84_007260 [Exophiala bonariae]
MSVLDAGQEDTPWQAKFPTPRTKEPGAITRDELLARFESGEKGGQDFLLVDVRRTDHEGGTITHSTNLPAQTLYYSIPSIYNLLQSGKIPLVIFYCGTSRGRGTRTAAWFNDFIEDQRKAGSESDDGFMIQSVILKGGIKGWVNAGEEYQKWMTAFEPDYWTQFADLRL